MKPERLPTKNPALSEAGAMTVPCGVDTTIYRKPRAKIAIIPETNKDFGDYFYKMQKRYYQSSFVSSRLSRNSSSFLLNTLNCFSQSGIPFLKKYL